MSEQTNKFENHILNEITNYIRDNNIDDIHYSIHKIQSLVIDVLQLEKNKYYNIHHNKFTSLNEDIFFSILNSDKTIGDYIYLNLMSTCQILYTKMKRIKYVFQKMMKLDYLKKHNLFDKYIFGSLQITHDDLINEKINLNVIKKLICCQTHFYTNIDFSEYKVLNKLTYYFTYAFNSDIVVSNNITKINLSNTSNKPWRNAVVTIKNIIGYSDFLTNVKFANLIFDDYLPSTIIELNLEDTFLKNSNIKILSKLKYLTISDTTTVEINELPDSLISLKIISDKSNYRINILPKNLETVEIGGAYNHDIQFPDSVKCISMGLSFNQKINTFPKNLIYLSLHGRFNQEIDFLPISVEHLQLGRSFTKPIHHLLNNLPNLKKIGIRNHEYPFISEVNSIFQNKQSKNRI